MKHFQRWTRRIGSGALGVLISLSGCTDTPPTQARKPGTELPSTAISLSNPVARSGSLHAGYAIAASGTELSVVYIALSPGSVARGSSVNVRNVNTGLSRTGSLVDGGLDPLAIPANVGDVVELTVRDGAEVVAHGRVIVERRRPPRIVRTVPTRGKRDVVLNTAIQVVFSEPMDSSSITSATLRLLQNGVPVEGRVIPSTDGLRADFVPAQLLAASAAYVFVVDAMVADPEGETLGAQERVEFVTGNESSVAPAASLSITPDTAVLASFVTDTVWFPGQVFLGPGSARLAATARDASGAEVQIATIEWTSSNSSVARINNYGFSQPSIDVEAVAPGQAIITARIGGVMQSARITVMRATVTPEALSLRIGEAGSFTASVKNAAGVTQTGWRAEWYGGDGLNPITAVSSTSPTRGLVSALTPGIEHINIALWQESTPEHFGTAFARVAVRSAGSVATLTIEPDSIRALPGAEVLVRATLRDENGAVTYEPVTWSFPPVPPGGCCQPTVTARTDWNWNEAGVDIGGLTGSFMLTATAGGRSDAINVINDRVRITDVAGHCALTSDADVYCEGSQHNLGYGLLGENGGGGPVAVVGGLDFTAIAFGADHACALSAAGAAYCWGLNSHGELGTLAPLEDCDPPNQRINCSSRPVPVAGGHTFSRISSAASSSGGYSCALTSGGQAHCWGANWSGQLGDGTTTHRMTPAAVAGGHAFTQISAGGEHTCALTSAGLAYCWGQNVLGQLGNGSNTDSHVPVQVSGGLTFSQIDAGWTHTCAIATGGGAYCWGSHGAGPDGSAPSAVLPELTVTDLSAGNDSCVLTSAGAVYCWGYYDPSPNEDESEWVAGGPFLLAGGQTFASLNEGGYRSCGITTGNKAYCWEFPYAPYELWQGAQR